MPHPATDGSVRNRREEVGTEGAGDEQNDVNRHADTNRKRKEKKDVGKEEKKPSALGRAWKKLDLDVPTLLMMMKWV